MVPFINLNTFSDKKEGSYSALIWVERICELPKLKMRHCYLKIWPTPGLQSCEETIQALISIISEVFDKEVLSIGIGVPSVVDRRAGIVYNVANIPYWEEVHLKELLTQRFSVPVFVDNDANCFALGERYFGKGQTVSNFVGLTIGTDLGGGIIQQGSCLPMPIVDPVNLVKYHIRNIIWNIIAAGVTL